MLFETSQSMEQIKSTPEGGRPRTEWSQVKHEVRFQRDLSNNKRLTVCDWQFEVRIDVRTYEDHFKFPNKKGLSLTLPRWKTLLSYREELTNALREAHSKQLNHKVQYHLGGGQFATVNPEYLGLDLRQYFVPAGTMKVHPTKKGIMLSEEEWNSLLSCVSDIKEVVPEMDSTQMCNEKPDHYFHLDTLYCRECNPFHALDKPAQY